RSARQPCEEEDSAVMEAQVKQEQIQLDQESPEENMVVREEERLCQEEEAQGEQAEKEEKKRKRNDGEKEEETSEKRLKASSLASLEEEEEEEDLFSDHLELCFRKIADITESVNRSIQKSNEIKKSQPPLPVSKIDDSLEQYKQAVEASTKPPSPVRHPSLEIATRSMIVSNTKSLWETEEITAQSAMKPSTSKCIPSGRRHKFVATGHGQEEKVLTDDAAEQ
ncbi:LSP1 protein, partial [Acrocephalus arundinaceus]|nr:LSP1 protein [Acrocephalus arundinaceus]